MRDVPQAAKIMLDFRQSQTAYAGKAKRFCQAFARDLTVQSDFQAEDSWKQIQQPAKLDIPASFR